MPCGSSDLRSLRVDRCPSSRSGNSYSSVVTMFRCDPRDTKYVPGVTSTPSRLRMRLPISARTPVIDLPQLRASPKPRRRRSSRSTGWSSGRSAALTVSRSMRSSRRAAFHWRSRSIGFVAALSAVVDRVQKRPITGHTPFGREHRIPMLALVPNRGRPQYCVQ